MSSHWPDASSMSELSEHQKAIVSAATSAKCCVLAGTPGTGKTFAAAAVIKRLTCDGKSVAVCAPTGKAAVRCTASLRANGVDLLNATTIHRLLGIRRNGHDGQGWGFMFNEQEPLPYQFVIVDESSMLDTDLFASLLRACSREAHVLMIGDPYQLPPVGHGAPLRDMMSSGRVPCGELTEIRRNSGKIVQGCRLIKDGTRFNPPTTINLTTGDNWRHFETSTHSQSIAQLKLSLTSLPSRFDPVWDVQVLVAVNERSPLSRKDINLILQDLLNPNGQRVDRVKFRVGDKVICTQNTFLPVAKQQGSTDEDAKEFVANGEIGKVLTVDPKKMTVEFASPPRRCIVPMSKSEKDGDSDGESTSSVGGFDLGYAITTHKAQGSQAPIVITLIDDSGSASRVTSREWYYTAISRAESLCVTIGKWSAFLAQSQRVVLRDRKTFLKERIQDSVGAKA